MPHPDFFDILSGILIAVMDSAAIDATHRPDLEIELAPLIATRRTNLTSWLPNQEKPS
jgi:hypothetical protein